MVEIIGTLANTKTEDGQIIDEWRLPALSKRQARTEALASSRLKGRSSSNITKVEELEDGRLPGQTIYLVEVVSER